MDQEISKGTTIQAAPNSPLWAKGARFGEVLTTKRDMVLARFPRIGTVWVPSNDVLEN